MSAGAQEALGAANEPASASQLQLAADLRDLAARAAQAAGGGVALIFAIAPDGSPAHPVPRLRAAAGFDSPQSAQEASRELASEVQQAMATLSLRRPGSVAALGPRGAGYLEIHPLVQDDRLQGALAVGCPSQLDSSKADAIVGLARAMALRLDHARLVQEVEQLRPSAKPENADAQTEEVLKLSEALFAQDIELLRNNEKLNKIEKLKNDFIEKMSLELRTPLNSIIEAIIGVLAGENEALSDSAKSNLRDALDEGTCFQRTLQNILDLWRIKQSELPVEIQDVNFRETIEEAIFSVQDSIDGKPLVVEAKLEEPFPKIRTDLTKISQMLFLLLDNAVKFTPAGRIDISARIADGRVICEIKDTGIGICPDDQQLIFDEFFQVDDSQSRKYDGAGLGLTLVRDLIKLLEGELSISSDAGRGTTVTFQLPVQAVG